MVKKEFIKLLADRADLTQNEAAKFLEAFQDVLLEEVIAKEDTIRLGIGTIGGKTKVTQDRMCRNPKSGEQILVKGKTVNGFPFIRWSKAAKE